MFSFSWKDFPNFHNDILWYINEINVARVIDFLFFVSLLFSPFTNTFRNEEEENDIYFFLVPCFTFYYTEKKYCYGWMNQLSSIVSDDDDQFWIVVVVDNDDCRLLFTKKIRSSKVSDQKYNDNKKNMAGSWRFSLMFFDSMGTKKSIPFNESFFHKFSGFLSILHCFIPIIQSVVSGFQPPKWIFLSKSNRFQESQKLTKQSKLTRIINVIRK